MFIGIIGLFIFSNIQYTNAEFVERRNLWVSCDFTYTRDENDNREILYCLKDDTLNIQFKIDAGPSISGYLLLLDLPNRNAWWNSDEYNYTYRMTFQGSLLQNYVCFAIVIIPKEDFYFFCVEMYGLSNSGQTSSTIDIKLYHWTGDQTLNTTTNINNTFVENDENNYKTYSTYVEGVSKNWQWATIGTGIVAITSILLQIWSRLKRRL